jgi:hypothetical protein
VVGIISYDNPGKFRVMLLGLATEPLKEKAREVADIELALDALTRMSNHREQ